MIDNEKDKGNNESEISFNKRSHKHVFLQK